MVELPFFHSLEDHTMCWPNELSAALSSQQGQLRQAVVNWWRNLELEGNAGETTWEVLDSIRDRVTECLMRSPPDLAMAASLTAEAALLVGGRNEN